MRAERQSINQAGFTLIELLLALAVIAVVATIVLPSFFRSYFDHRTLDQAVSSVMETMLTAKQLAIQSSSPYVYEFTRGSNVQRIYPLTRSAKKQTVTLPAGIRLEPDLQDLTTSNRMIFREDGSTEGIALLVIRGTQSQPIQVQRRLGIPQRIVGK
ncbi:MAG: prepilin-type N-terminal cleavage/methylation domain-containing protein [Pirellulaceae bacterium]|nr:prepilin-type N-terminal cleavage/methylation domain-containing protein [Pirellulaceae bacterium]